MGMRDTSYEIRVTNKGCRNLLQRAGFTLIEVTISATLLVFSSVVFGTLMAANLNSLNQIKRETQALYAVCSKMEEVRILSFSALDQLNCTSFDEGKGKIKITPISEALRKIEMDYEYAKGRKPIRLGTMIGN